MKRKRNKVTQVQRHYDKCPKCGSTNIDCKNGIWYCYECQKEW